MACSHADLSPQYIFDLKLSLLYVPQRHSQQISAKGKYMNFLTTFLFFIMASTIPGIVFALADEPTDSDRIHCPADEKTIPADFVVETIEDKERLLSAVCILRLLDTTVDPNSLIFRETELNFPNLLFLEGISIGGSLSIRSLAFPKLIEVNSLDLGSPSYISVLNQLSVPNLRQARQITLGSINLPSVSLPVLSHFENFTVMGAGASFSDLTILIDAPSLGEDYAIDVGFGSIVTINCSGCGLRNL